MSNINLPVNPGESKTLTFNTADTYMPEDLVFNIEGDSILKTISGTTPGNGTSGSYLSTKWRINDTDTELRDGRIIMLRVPSNRGVSPAGTVLSIDNGTTYRPVAYNVSALTTHYATNSTIILVYNPNIKLTHYLTSNTKTENVYGVWCAIGDYDSNSNTIGYQLRTNSYTLPVSAATGRYRLLFTSADGTKFVPACTGTSTSATTVKTVSTTPIDPFKNVLYYGSTTILSADDTPAVTILWQQYNITLGYSFCPTANATITDKKPVYVKCTPQTNGSAVIDSTTPYVQDLPTTEDGKIYKFIGVATSTTTLELNVTQPVYQYKNGKIQLYTSLEDTDTLVGQTAANDNNYYPILFSETTTSSITDGAHSSKYKTDFTFNPSGSYMRIGSNAANGNLVGIQPSQISVESKDSTSNILNQALIAPNLIKCQNFSNSKSVSIEPDKIKISSLTNASYLGTDSTGKIISVSGPSVPSSASDLPHHHTYDKASLNGNASSGVSYISSLTIPNSNNVATADHTHTYYKQVLNGDASSGTAYVSSITAASSGHTHSVPAQTITLTANDSTATGRIAYVSSVTKTTGGAASAGHTHTFTQPTISLGSNTTSTDGVAYVESVTKTTNGAASGTHTHPYKLQQLDNTATTGGVTYVESITASATNHTHTFTQPTISLGSNTTSDGGVQYVHSVEVTTNGAAAAGHTHPYKKATMTYDTTASGGEAYLSSVTAPSSNSAATATHTHAYAKPTYTFNSLGDDCYELEFGTESTATGSTGQASAGMKALIASNFTTKYMHFGEESTASGTTSQTTSKVNSIGTVTTKYFHPTATSGAVGAASGTTSGTTKHLTLSLETTASGTTSQTTSKVDTIGTVTTKYFHPTATSGAVGAASGTVDVIGTVTTKYLSAANTANTTGTPSGTTSGTSKNLAIDDASSTTNTGTPSAGTKAVTGGTSKNLGVSYTTTDTSSVINN